MLIFYGWTLVVSVGCLGFMFLPFWIAALLILVGLAICTVVTLAPLSKRKALEVVAQSAGADDTAVDPEVAKFDGLDAAGVDPDDLPVPASLPKDA